MSRASCRCGPLLPALLVALAASCAASSRPAFHVSEDAYLNTPERVQKYGYPVEEHWVTGETGYVMRVFRVPRGRPQSQKQAQPPDSARPAIYLQHGVVASSDIWLLLGEKSFRGVREHAGTAGGTHELLDGRPRGISRAVLGAAVMDCAAGPGGGSSPPSGVAFVLADAGYDVWLGNARGNVYSTNHTRLDPNSEEFWQFSWHESGMEDLPAVVDYVLQQTRRPGLVYVGHSMGGTMFYVLASLRPEYSRKVRAAFLLAPAVFMSDLYSPPLRAAAPLAQSIAVASRALLKGRTPPLSLPVGHPATLLPAVVAYSVLAGFSDLEDDHLTMAVYLTHVSQGGSLRQAVHYAQEILSGHFRQFDYGRAGNMRRYGRATPPDYPLEKVAIPHMVMYGDDDWYVSMQDVKRLQDALPKNIVEMYRVPEVGFTHMDFMWGRNARRLIYDKILASIVNTEPPIDERSLRKRRSKRSNAEGKRRD
ncbi:lipase 3-like isoform X1 [Schistocerca gregaria]|uniref:lipase 3-like isoform X1 n=1 Tax=Schistocerca gregaria TaxID=7010 RepID=UPI00211E17D1|nr:lipase 3-like isoform X1 [Schistocerca gregaria]